MEGGKELLERDLTALRGVGRGISNYYLVVVEIRWGGGGKVSIEDGRHQQVKV